MSDRPVLARFCGAALLLLLAPLILAGCGFHLQGRLELPAGMERTYIRAVDTHSPFYWELRRGLRDAGVAVTDDEALATAVLSIYLDETDQRVLSVSARNTPTEYEVYYTVRYGITQGEDVIVPAQDLTLTRDYTYDPTLVLGKAHEETILRDSIARDLVRIVLKQASVQ